MELLGKKSHDEYPNELKIFNNYSSVSIHKFKVTFYERSWDKFERHNFIICARGECQNSRMWNHLEFLPH